MEVQLKTFLSISLIFGLYTNSFGAPIRRLQTENPRCQVSRMEMALSPYGGGSLIRICSKKDGVCENAFDVGVKDQDLKEILKRVKDDVIEHLRSYAGTPLPIETLRKVSRIPGISTREYGNVFELRDGGKLTFTFQKNKFGKYINNAFNPNQRVASIAELKDGSVMISGPGTQFSNVGRNGNGLTSDFKFEDEHKFPIVGFRQYSDRYLISVDTEGNQIQWDLDTGRQYAQFGARHLENKLKKSSLPDANYTPRNPALEKDLKIIDAIGSFEGLMDLNSLDSFDAKNCRLDSFLLLKKDLGQYLMETTKMVPSGNGTPPRPVRVR